jgi:hypothetical protein
MHEIKSKVQLDYSATTACLNTEHRHSLKRGHPLGANKRLIRIDYNCDNLQTQHRNVAGQSIHSNSDPHQLCSPAKNEVTSSS